MIISLIRFLTARWSCDYTFFFRILTSVRALQKSAYLVYLTQWFPMCVFRRLSACRFLPELRIELRTPVQGPVHYPLGYRFTSVLI